MLLAMGEHVVGKLQHRLCCANCLLSVQMLLLLLSCGFCSCVAFMHQVTRQRATEGQQEPAGSFGPADGAGVNNGSGSHNSSHTSSKRPHRTAALSNPQPGPVLPSSPLLNNRQDKGRKPPTPAPADLEGSSSEAFAGSGSGSGHGSGSTDGGSDSSRLTPGVESGGSEQAHKQQQQLADGGTRSASRRKQQWRPCHAALQ
jgi:hypothetical protein